MAELTSPPACGCLNGSDGSTLLGMFDMTPEDCAVAVDEIANNSLIEALLAPDVSLSGTKAISIGVGFSATKATFTVP